MGAEGCRGPSGLAIFSYLCESLKLLEKIQLNSLWELQRCGTFLVLLDTSTNFSRGLCDLRFSICDVSRYFRVHQRKSAVTNYLFVLRAFRGLWGRFEPVCFGVCFFS
jgi:hypothetical protein